MRAIFKRELQGYFYTAAAYVYMGVFLTLGCVFFAINNLAARSSDLNNLLWMMSYLWMLLTPILTMRSFAGERKARTAHLARIAVGRCGRQVPGGVRSAAVQRGAVAGVCAHRGAVRPGLSAGAGRGVPGLYPAGLRLYRAGYAHFRPVPRAHDGRHRGLRRKPAAVADGRAQRRHRYQNRQ